MQSLGIDTAFANAVQRWRQLIAGEAVLELALHGTPTSLIPSTLVVRTPGGEIDYSVDRWPSSLPRDCAALRHCGLVWDHFSAHWTLDDLRAYCQLGTSSSEVEVRDRLATTAWWRAFQELVSHAAAYEWRVALHALADGAPVRVCRPEPDEAPLSEFEQRLTVAAVAFEASSFDAQLLYDGGARVTALLLQMGAV